MRNRTREIGTRVALGATEARILALFLGRSARHLAIGLLLGGALGALLLILTERRLGPLGASAPAYAIVVASLLLVAFAAARPPPGAPPACPHAGAPPLSVRVRPAAHFGASTQLAGSAAASTSSRTTPPGRRTTVAV